MSTLSKPAANKFPNMSWSCPLLPRCSPTRPPCSRPLTLPALAVALPADQASNTLHACPHQSHPGRPARARAARPPARTPHHPLHPPDTAPCRFPPARRRPARARAARGLATPPPDPPHHPLPSMLLPAYKTCPLASTLHHTTTTTPPFHPAAAEEQPELETELFSHRAVTPPWCVSGDATAT